MATVFLGNTAPTTTSKDVETGEVTRRPSDRAKTITTVWVDPGSKLVDVLKSLTDSWDNHASTDPPSWVESDNEALKLLIIENYSNEDHTVADGRPDDWDEDEGGD